MGGKNYVSRWKRRLSLLLSVVLISSQGGIASLASGSGQPVQVVEVVAELPEEVRNQSVSLGTSEYQLNLPAFLKVMTKGQGSDEDEDRRASASSGEKASASSARKKNRSSGSSESSWQQVPVIWVLAEADNGLTVYDGETPGIYRFEARLEDDRYEADGLELPDITVKVGEIQEGFTEGIIDLGAPETTMTESFFGLEDDTVDLTDGNHEKWIDRIDVPDYALNFYSMLEESVDNDGKDDLLIDDRYFTKAEAVSYGSYVFNGIPFASMSRTEQLGDKEWAYIRKCATAALDAFDRDHPEVFWLTGRSMLYWSCDVSRDSSNQWVYNYTLYWMTRVHEGNSYVGYDVRFDEYKSGNAVRRRIQQIDEQVDAIFETVTSDDPVDQILAFNEWLTMHNAYNTTDPLDSAPKWAWECTSALAGSSGTDGPVCEAYSRAFKVLCDRAGIPCVLVDGPANGIPDDGHMWNYVKVDGEWYGVDVTWNDPFVSSGAAVSGYEGTTWFLLGSETVAGSQNYKFIESHPVNNDPRGVNFINGPKLSRERYPMTKPEVEFKDAGQTVVYTGSQPSVTPPVVTVNGRQIQDPSISYSYRNSGDTGYTDGLPVDAGSYILRARAAASKTEGYRGAYSSGTLSLVIERAARSVSSPTVAEQTDESITLNPVMPSAGAKDGKVEYAYSTDGSLPDGGWQTSPVITGLKRNTEYYLFARITGGKNYQDAVSEGTRGKTDKTKVPKPSLKQNVYPYTGENVSVEVENFDGSIMKIAGNSAVESGNHQAVVTLESEDFIWQDGTREPVKLDWKIMIRRSLPAPSASADGVTESKIVLKEAVPVPSESAGDGKFEYGYAAENDVSKVSAWKTDRTFTGLESGTTYYFFARVTGGTLYMDAVSPSASLTTKRIQVKKPVLSDSGSYVYQGSQVQAAVSGYDAGTMRVSGNTAVHAGRYNVKIGLIDSKHYEWEDGTTAEVSLEWEITKKQVKVKAADKTKYYGEDNPALSLETPEEGVLAGSDSVSALKVTLSTTAEKNSAPGSYPIVGTGADDGDYKVTVEEGILTVRKKAGSGGSGGGSSNTSTKNQGDGQQPGRLGLVTAGKGNIYEGSWVSSGQNWRLKLADGSYAAGQWGLIGQRWYLFGQDSRMLTGWQKADGQWYFLHADGAMATGWILDNNRWYYMRSGGAMATGWEQVGYKWYFMNADGAMASGWIADGGKWYYLGTDGAMYASATTPDGYQVNADGAWVVNGVVQTQ